MPVTIMVQLLALHLIITVPHELGHFVAARLVGVSVPEFGIGLPPTVVAVRWRGTRWSLNLLPLGAFIGYNPIGAHPSLRRSAIAIAGPTANFLVAFGCLVFIVASELGGSFGLGGQVVRHLLNGLAHPWSGDEVFSLVGLTAPELAKHLSQWEGVTPFLRMVLSASVVVGVCNLLPLPSLDGGKLLSVAMRFAGWTSDIEYRGVRVGLSSLAILAVAAIVFSLRVGY